MAQKSQQSNTQVVAHAYNVRLSPRKMRLVTNLVKGLPAKTALVQLQFVNKKGAPVVSKLIASAVANAEHNFSLDPATLYIKSITCDMGSVMKRMFPRARGSGFVIRRKLSHVHVTLESKGKGKATKAVIAESDSDEKKTKAVTAEQATPKTPKTRVKQTSVKTSEQQKEQKVQQKRRLFNQDSE